MTYRSILHVAITLAIGVGPMVSSAQAPAAGAADAASFELDLGGLRFDPLSSPPLQPSSPWGRTKADGDDWRLVQFKGPIQ